MWIPIAIGAVVGGTMNVISNWGNINSGWDALEYFTVGAVVGGISAGIASSLLVAGIIPGAVVGAGAGGITNGMLQMGNNLIAGNDLMDGVGRAVWQGAAMGGILGGYSGYKIAKADGLNYFWGTSPDKWAYNRGQWSLAWWDKPDVYEVTEMRHVSQIRNKDCVYASLEMIDKYYGVDDANQLGIKNLYPPQGEAPTDPEMIKIIDAKYDYQIMTTGIDNEDIVTSIQNGNPILIAKNTGISINSVSYAHAEVIYKVKVYPTGKIKIITYNPAGWSSVYLKNDFRLMVSILGLK